jgi:thiol-disulfide isomerase/thioredoxin
MDKLLWRRRQLLRFLGFGMAGAGTATLVGLYASNKGSSTANSNVGSSLTAMSGDRSENQNILAAARSSALPEFQGVSQWLNSSPLSIAQLKGSVVLVQFWTFACINCQRTLPYLVRWHQTYAKQGLKIIGIHTPEFAFERDVKNVQQALRRHHLTYPVGMDNEYKTWNAYSNQYWPHLFLADRRGLLQYDHIGEGAYDTTEQTIRRLLG